MGMQNETLQNITVESVFNYNASQLPSKLVAIVADNAEVEAVSEGTASLIFAETPFYAEMGGQVADHGQILDAAGNVVATVTDVQKAPNGQALHTVEVLAPLALNQEYTLAIDTNRRHRVMKNHTATHLLHAALHNILGHHATQAGSLNEVEFLRFDFTHFQAVTPEELRAKRNSILKHQSQMESAPFLGNDERLFWQRSEDRNRGTAELYDKLGLACYEAMEAFVEYKFKEM